MTRTRGFTIRAVSCFVVAGIPIAILGCQNEGRSDGAPSGTAQAAGATSAQPSGVRFDDTTKTNMLLRQIHAANQDEIDMGKLAQEKAQSAEVKKFANQMVTDHSSADQKLTDLAKRSNLDLNAAPMDPIVIALQSAAEDKKRMMRGISGAQFDAAYVAPQVDNHSVVLKLVEEAQKTASGDTRKLLDETRPVVESHLDHAKTLMRGLTFSPSAVGGGPMQGEGAPMGSAQSPSARGDAGRQEQPKKSTPKPNQQ
jgi:putative membrane protein